jgi:pimeloyl-ACP methyl ester carboxylesterase
MASAHEPGEVAWVEVPGGRLAVEMIRSGTEPVLAIHGISSQRKLWNWLRAAAPDLGLIAPDLRGRGDSVGVTLPSSIGRHAADMVLVLNNLGLEAVHVCGMSMGGFVAVEMATAFPGRVKSLILVDGGLPMAAPPGLTPETLPAVFASRLARMDREFASVRDYAKFFTRTAPLLDPDDPLQLQVPVRLLTAEWSTGADSAPAYPADAVQSFRDALDVLVTVRPVPGVDHAASIMTMTGARATADLIAEALAPETLA